MFVAVCDQLFGTSPSFLPKIARPFSHVPNQRPGASLPFEPRQRGLLPPSVKYRRKSDLSPAPPAPIFGARIRGQGISRSMRVSPCHPPSPRSWVPSRGGTLLILLLAAPQRCPLFPSGLGLEVTQLEIRSSSWSGHRKQSRWSVQPLKLPSAKPMPWPLCASHSPNSRGFPPHLACAELDPRARFFFRLNPGRFVAHRDLASSSPLRSVWRFHVPRIWIRSTNGREFLSREKRKLLVGDVSYCV